MAFANPPCDLSRDRTVNSPQPGAGILSHILGLFRNPGVSPSLMSLPGNLLFNESILPFFGNSSLYRYQHILTEAELVYKPDYPFVPPSTLLLGS